MRQGMATLSQPIFLSTLSLRRATCGAVWGRCAPQISIHALLAESDCFCLCHLPAPGNFYPRSPCGERRHYLAQPQARHNFYPRSPCGERPSSVLMALPSYIFLSTLSLRRATVDFSSNARATLISIHALLAESDMPISTSFPIALNFYPRSPCGERRWRCSCRRLYSNFYPRSPCGERRHSCRADAGDQPISIHALLAESDATTATTSWCARYFYPRSPCGERRSGTKSVNGDRPFLSTLSLRRATCNNCIFCFCHKISIHALLAESDVSLSIMMQLCEISIHALLAESDPKRQARPVAQIIFLSTLSLRRATDVTLDCLRAMRISIHALLAESDYVITVPSPNAD